MINWKEIKGGESVWYYYYINPDKFDKYIVNLSNRLPSLLKKGLQKGTIVAHKIGLTQRKVYYVASKDGKRITNYDYDNNSATNFIDIKENTFIKKYHIAIFDDEETAIKSFNHKNREMIDKLDEFNDTISKLKDIFCDRQL